MSSSSSSSSVQLPQPSCSEAYQYILHDAVASTLFPPPLPVGTLCFITHGTNAYFRRARVVEDDATASNSGDSDRILIRYPSGSTYRVRRNKVHPTLEHGNHDGNSKRRRCVLIYPETPIYRQACVTHTYWEDSFLEIGCDGGNTVERVHRGLQQGGFVAADPCAIEPQGVSSSSSPTTTTRTTMKNGGIQCLGIDKSQFSIDTATEAHPQCSFSLQDALEDACSLRQYCHETLLHGHPTVVAIDINGNREIPAVVRCIENIMNPVDPPEGWELPRLIIVKARRLHHAMLEGGGQVQRGYH